MTALKRNMATKIAKLLEQFPVVVIVGARQTGKTTLAKQLLPTWKYMDMENPDDFDRIFHDPLFFFRQHPRQVIIDEAQFYPHLFNVLRGVIDEKRQEKSRFLLTGSSSPLLLAQVSESLAGRVAIVELGTLKANEYYQLPLSPFYQLFTHKLNRDAVVSGDAPITNDAIQALWLRGGYPEPVLSSDELFFATWMQQYRDAYINRDIARLFPRLNRVIYQRFLTMLSKLSGTIINRSDVARTLEVNEKSVREYMKIIEGTFIWRELPSFEKNSIKSIVKMPKGYLRDSGLLHHFLRVETLDDLYTHPMVGHSFESFVIEELIKGIQALSITNWDASYYRTRSGSEIDLILNGVFGTLPIEIKYGTRVDYRQLRSIIDFVKSQQLPFGVVINQSAVATWLTPEIVQIPVGWL